MTETVTDITAAIVALVAALRDATVAEVEDAVDTASDRLSTGDRTDDLAVEAILDGVRYGHRAAVTVERRGGMMVRIIDHGGVRLTHELGRPGDDVARAAIRRAVHEAVRTRRAPLDPRT